MQFLYDYGIFLDVLALLVLICLAAGASIQMRSIVLGIVAIIVSVWALVRLFGLI